jgi:hypothetical protein
MVSSVRNSIFEEFHKFWYEGKCEVNPLQAWTGHEASGNLRFSDFKQSAHYGSYVVNAKHQTSLPSMKNFLVLFSVTD